MEEPRVIESKRQTILCLLLALVSSYAICARFTAAQGVEASFPELLYLGNKTGALVAAVLFAVLFAWYRTIARKTPTYRPAVWILSAAFSLALVVGRAFTVVDVTYGVYGTFDTLFSSWQRCAFTAILLLGLFTVTVALVGFLFERLDMLRDSIGSARANGEPKGSSRQRLERTVEWFGNHQPWSFAALFVVCWLPYIVVFFPGAIYADGALQLAQFFGTSPYTGHHPLAVTLLFGSLVQVGRFLGSDTLGVFFCTMLQTLALAYACARIVGCVAKSAPKAHGLWGGAWLTAAFFALVPLWGTAVVSIKKDALFYALFGLLCVAAFEYANRGASRDASRWKEYARLFFLALGVSLVRNEGIIFACAMLCCLAVYLLVLKCPRKQGLVLAGLAVAVVGSYWIGYKVVLMQALDAESGSIGEALTIPLQQTARYWIMAPEDVDDSIAAGVERVLDTNGLTESVYNPQISDNIKFGYFNAESTAGDLLAFARSYLEMGIKHPGIFAEAFIDQTLGWWYPELYGDPDHVVAGMGIWQLTPAPDVYKDAVDSALVFQDSGAPRLLTSLIDCVAYVPGFGILVYPPVYFWTLVLLAAYALSNRERSKAILYLPFFLYYLICIASPVSGLTRYAMPLMMALPLLFVFTMRKRVESD